MNGVDMMKDGTIECAAEGGCEPVTKRIKGLEDLVYNEDRGITALNKTKVPWSAISAIALVLFLSLIGSIVYFSEIRVQAKEYPETKKDVQILKEDVIDIKRQIKTFEEWKKEDRELKKEIIILLNQIAEDKKPKK